MSNQVIIALPVGGKLKIPLDTYQEIKKAARIMAEDDRVARYVAAPHEGITPEIVGVIRQRLIKRGDLPARAYSRRHEAIPQRAEAGRSWRAPLADV
jgi:16S rRNA C1402 (ribose-2'-O) methylase RsmI